MLLSRLTRGVKVVPGPQAAQFDPPERQRTRFAVRVAAAHRGRSNEESVDQVGEAVDVGAVGDPAFGND